MRRPAVARILIKSVISSDILRKPYRLENPHIFPAGKHIGALNTGIDSNDAPRGKLPLVQLAVLKLGRQRIEKIAPDERFVRDIGILPHRNLGKVDNLEMVV